MNIQTEHLEDSHVARITVELEPERIKKAFEAASRRLAQRAKIPGFRQGKAPYAVILKYFGTQGLLEESIEKLADEVYKAALDETKIQPYTIGALDDIKMTPPAEGDANPNIPKISLVFSIPKAPDVDLREYRDELRLPFEVPEVTPEQIDRALRSIREGRAQIEPSAEPVKLGDKVKVSIKGKIQRKRMDYDLTDAEIESDKAVTTPVEEEDVEEEQEVILRTGADDDVMPGFSEQLVGLKDGESKEFTLVYGEDSEYDEWANNTAILKAEVSEIRSVQLPPLDDEFANTVTEGRYPTVAEYRVKIGEDLQAEMTRLIENRYAQEALDELTAGADMAYPDAMVDDYTTDIIKEMENNLQEQGLSLEQFMTLERLDMPKLRENYRELAMQRLERSLALGKIVETENLRVGESDVDAAIDKMVESLGEQAQTFKKMFNNPQSRANIALDLIKDMALTRLTSIAKGENPPLAVDASPLVIDLPTEPDAPQADTQPDAQPVPEIAAIAESTPVEDAPKPE